MRTVFARVAAEQQAKKEINSLQSFNQFLIHCKLTAEQVVHLSEE